MKVTFDEFPRGTRHVFAGVFGVVGAGAAWLFHPLAAVPSLFLMIFTLLIRNSISFDLERRTYRAHHLFKTYGGTFADLKGIKIERVTLATVAPARNRYHATTNEALFEVTLVWVDDGGTPYSLASSSTFDEMLAYAHHASEEFGLPMIEGRELVKYRAEIEKAHHALSRL